MKIQLDNEEIDFPADKTIMDYLRGKQKHIPGVCKMKELDPYGACRLCLVDVNDRIQIACSTHPRDGAVVKTNSKKVLEARKTALELMLSDHFGDCIGPCVDGCPTKSDVQGYLALAAQGKYHEAVALMKRDYILPAALGRVCPAFCEEECRRQLVEGPLAIRAIKRFAADYDLDHGPWMPDIPKATGKKIAVVGGGPAGLSCAFYLRTMGHDVTIYEAMPELGGMLRYGIPKYRLPKDILAKDIDTVIKTGIEVKTNTRVGKDIAFEKLHKDYDAVFVGIGSWVSTQIRYDGCELPGVMDAIDFLRDINMEKKVEIGPNVLVVGGGNTAIDVARTAKRMGCDVTIAYRRSRNEMPAEKREIDEAEEEGVRLMLLSNPVKILGKEKVAEVELVKMELGEPDESGRCRPIVCEGTNYCIDIDNVVLAIGQRNDQDFLNKIGLENDRGWLKYDQTTYQTNLPGVFVGGDVALGPSTVIESIAHGKNAAIMIDMFFKDKIEITKKCIENPIEHLEQIYADEELKETVFRLAPYNHWKDVTEEDYKDRERMPRVKMHVLPTEKRKDNFDEVELTLKEKEVQKEVERCMSCGCYAQFDCLLREYSTFYGAKQDTFKGELHSDPIDDSHPNVILDNNKCILCGRCVNLTHEITGEGLIDNLNRGFTTKNAPALTISLGEVKGNFVGNFVDVCPTGAFTLKTPYPKDGPWRVKSVPTVCNGCSMGCEFNIDIYKDFAVNVSAKDDSWNHGIICDKGRFSRVWEEEIEKPLIKKGKKFVEISAKEAKELIKKHLKGMAIALGPEITNEEAKTIKKFADKKGMKIGALFDKGVSTTKLAKIFTSKRIQLDVKTKDYPLLKPFIHIAKKQGAEVTKKNPDIAIVEAPTTPEEDLPTIVLHKGLNEVGLMEMGFSQPPKAKSYLLVGSTKKKLDGYIISIGMNKQADLILPIPKWINREGTIVTSEKRELQVNKVFDGPKIIDIIKNYL